MLGTDKVTVLGAAHAEAAKTAAKAIKGMGCFMGNSFSIEKRQDVGECKRDQHQGHKHPKGDFVEDANSRYRTDITSGTGPRGAIEAPPGQTQSQQGNSYKEGAIRLQESQIAYPGTTKAQ